MTEMVEAFVLANKGILDLIGFLILFAVIICLFKLIMWLTE